MLDCSEEAVAYHERRAQEEARLAETETAARIVHQELCRLHDIRSALLSAARRGPSPVAGRTDKEA